ncbi:MAG: polymer-forming cytoskeletal protein, partial [Candidatus Omnitrophica bacterium]|nr:polymer-forming cytoskeletal protein [Candidatus Omnitrophota bacterium]
MFNRKTKATEVRAEDRILEIDASMRGSLSFKDPVNLMINGNFEGELDAVGTLTIGETAMVKARIRGERVILKGEMIGDLTASRSLEIHRSGRLVGDLETPSLSMHTGAVLQGQLSMLSAIERSGLERPEADVLNPEELAAYL